MTMQGQSHQHLHEHLQARYLQTVSSLNVSYRVFQRAKRRDFPQQVTYYSSQPHIQSTYQSLEECLILSSRIWELAAEMGLNCQIIQSWLHIETLPLRMPLIKGVNHDSADTKVVVALLPPTCQVGVTLYVAEVNCNTQNSSRSIQMEISLYLFIRLSNWSLYARFSSGLSPSCQWTLPRHPSHPWPALLPLPPSPAPNIPLDA